MNTGSDCVNFKYVNRVYDVVCFDSYVEQKKISN